ncbi:DUF3310 domain-containing protein [Staphylococcus ureilyticus]|uniref:DUF3310 domain-containing protein n=1 Tax=Staphylococcus ureilyticus TaxID=94138 RepID=UPI002900D76A|nr:DUF3310 domain-containing protein [Staphylococcus ureilyticus]MDU0461955.1 DUF3310 domain-containing protein [Staphylococcus ureilyticus]
MKISDLNLDDHVIVYDIVAYDIVKNEYSEGKTVVGRVDEIIFNEDGKNEAIINVTGDLYGITDNNYFELWTKEIADKTESMSNSEGLSGFTVDKKLLEEAKEKGIDELRKRINQSNDVQQRKRKEEDTALFKIKDLKVGYKVKVLGDNMTGEVSEIADNGKSAEIRVGNGVYRVINDNNDFTITEWNAVPEYAEDTVNHPSHYNYGDIEVIDYCDQVCKQYPPELAPYVFNAIKYLSRANHKNGREDIDKAKYYVQRLFDKWDQ